LPTEQEEIMAQRIATFDDCMDLFHKWQKDIGFDPSLAKGYNFDAIYADPPHEEIEFGEFKGRKKWEKVLEIPKDSVATSRRPRKTQSDHQG
jgi:hypothetical protein